MNPGDNLDLAEFLFRPPKGAPPEASFRGACSRAYYAAFGIARDALAAAQFSNLRGRDTHKRVQSLLKDSSDADVKKAGGMLWQLHRTRKGADYDVGHFVVRGQVYESGRAQRAVLFAAQIITTIQQAEQRLKRLGIPAQVT